MLTTHPAALHRLRLGRVDEKSMRESAPTIALARTPTAWPPRPKPWVVRSAPAVASALALNDVLERIQGPGEPVADVGLGLLKRLDTRFRALELEP